MTAVRTYVLRLYRRPTSRQALAGVVEMVPDGHRHSFGSFEELKAIPCPPARTPARGGITQGESPGTARTKLQPSRRR
jgi:hypothetical protein